MSRSIQSVLNSARLALMLAVMVVVWLLFIMVYLDKFLSPFDRLIPFLMPWKKLYATPSGDIGDRMALMKGLLDSSNNVSNVAFLIMTISFLLFSLYLAFVYQQRKRRSRENKLLQLKNQEIARRNEFIRYISATIGHEFKNNLGRIKRRLDLLPGIPEEAKERIDNNMEKLFADIDVFKRISVEREEGLVDFVAVDLRQMLSRIAQQFSDLADVTFQTNISPPAIFASTTLLKTVFENLFDNAIKYKKPEQARAQITLSCSLDIDGNRRYVRLTLRDKGIGMDEIQADSCFYKRMGSEKGWGEGLYFVKYVIGLHAGKIRVGREYTAPGVGTEIIINLPFVEENLDV